MSSNDRGNKRRASQELAGPSKQRPEADPAAGSSSTHRVRSIDNDRYYEYHSDSESELDGEELEADHRVFNSATEQERHTAAEITRHIMLITQQSSEHGAAMLKQILCMLGPYFPGMPKDPRTVLTGPWNIEPEEVDGGHFWYRGLEAGILENVSRDTKEVKFDVYVGVAPLPQLTSPELKTWVILARLHEATKPPGEPFVAGVFCGNSRPTCEEFLGSFSEEAARLCESPLTVNGDSLTVKPRVVIADVAERAFIKGTVNQSCFYGCSKCTIKGELVFRSNLTFFGQPNTTRRTNEEFRCGVYASNHQQVADGQPVVTPLARLPIDLVEDAIVGDNRHLLHLGVVKNMYSVFVKGAANVPEMDVLYQELLQYVLTKVEFPHERRTIARQFNTNIAEWSPSMWGYFLDVVGIVVLGQVRQPACYELYCRLHWAVAICNHARFSSYLNAARRLLQQCVTMHNDLVGSVTCNAHHLLHLVDEVRRFGPLPLQSSNPFEAKLSVLRHKVDLTKAGLPVQQVATALLLHERARTKPLPIIPTPTNNGRRVKIRKNFLLKNSANDKDSWFLVPGSGSSSRGQVVKFISAKADPFVVCGRPLTEQTASGNNPFADPIGLDVFVTGDKEDLQSMKEYSVQDMICKLCVVWMPTYISFVPLPESFAES